MKEHAELYALYESLRATGGTGVLATVVRTSGSTYRRSGARMLVSGDGRSAGLISGGCLENDLRERSGEVFREGKPLLVTYDSTSPGDVLWGLGLGCPGIAHVLLERVSAVDESPVIAFIEECRRLRSAGAIATIYAVRGNAGVTPGSRLCLREGEQAAENDPLDAKLARACEAVLAARSSSHEVFTLPAGGVKTFVEFIPPPVSLSVFGAGPDAVPLVRLAREMGWRVTVVDGRPAYLRKEFFPSADELVLAHPGEMEGMYALPDGAAAVVMTHNFDNDVSVVRTLLSSAASYIGLLGPRAKADLLLGRLSEEGIVLTEDDNARFHSPVGLDIGAETPEEIALAIVAEIQAALRGRSGAPLRQRKGPIHR